VKKMDEASSRTLPKALLLILLLVGCAASAFAQAPDDSFSIVVLPDPQNYSQYYPSIFKQQTQWIVDHRADLNIQFVVGVGDMVNHPDSDPEWANADQAVQVLDAAGIPYAMAIGNHDYDGVYPTARKASAFNQWFGAARYAANPSYKANLNGSNENFYELLTVGATEYLVLVLEYYPRDAVLDWASQVIADHPSDPVIVVTHSFMYIDNTRVDECDTNDTPSAGATPETPCGRSSSPSTRASSSRSVDTSRTSRTANALTRERMDG